MTYYATTHYPLELGLEITTVGKCIMNCRFCPQQLFQERYQGSQRLSLENFKKILLKVPKTVSIHFSGFAEPFLNPECIDMIEHAHSKGFKIVLFTTLVGLKSEDVKRLKSCNPFLVLHLPDNLGNSNIVITEEYKDTLITVLKMMRIDGFSIMNDNMVPDPRAGLIRSTLERHVYGSFYCRHLVFPHFVMLPNCEVVLCFMDFGLEHRLGNLLEQSYMEIARSPNYKDICARRFKKDDSAICRKCSYAVPLKHEFAKKCNRLMFNTINTILDR
jgi:MoaA/NifB/PqqE/SkfB family radical SAM enzyme